MNHTVAQSCLGIALATDLWILVLEAVVHFLRKLMVNGFVCNSRHFPAVWSLLQKGIEKPLSKNIVHRCKAAGITCSLKLHGFEHQAPGKQGTKLGTIGRIQTGKPSVYLGSNSSKGCRQLRTQYQRSE